METTYPTLSKRKKLLQDFSKLRVLIAHQLEQQYSREFAERVFQRAKKEFEKMIPELPLIDLESTKEHTYLRLFIFSAMSMAVYFSLVHYLKDKKIAKRIVIAFFRMNLPIGISFPAKVLTRWMFRRFERRLI